MLLENVKTKIRIVCLIAVVTITTVSCASGPKFEPIHEVSPDKALIYIYRPPGLRGSAFSPEINIEDQVKFYLQKGGYYPYLSTPGEVTIYIKNIGGMSITMEVIAGQTYYVKGGTLFMGMGIPFIEAVPTEDGLIEIQDCKLLPDVVLQE